MKLNIITPCSRPQNLEAIARSILRGFRKAGLSDFDYWIPPVPVRWWIVFDMNCLDYEQVNKACLSVSNVEYCVVQPTFLFNKKTGELKTHTLYRYADKTLPLNTPLISV